MRGALITFAMLIAPTAAFAQNTGGTQPTGMGRWDVYREQQEDQKRRDDKDAKGDRLLLVPKQQVINDFAACVVTQGRDQALGVMATEPNSKDEHDRLAALARSMDRCTRGRAFISGKEGEFRGALAEAFVQTDSGRKDRIRSAPATAPSRAALVEGRAFVVGYGRCIAQANPGQSLLLLETPHGTPAEQEAVLAMGETLKACMPEGAQYRLNIRDLRNHIADSLYKLSEVAA